MASVSEEILIELKFTEADTAQRIAKIYQELEQLNKTYKDTKKAVTENGTATEEQAQVLLTNRKAVQDLTAELKFYEKQLKAERKEQEQVIGSVNSMRDNLKKLLAQYDALSAEARNGDFGKRLRDQINMQTDAIKEAEFSTQRYQRNVGNYANAMREALAGSVPAVGQFSNALVGLKTSAGWIGLAIQAIVAIVGALGTAFKRTEGNSDKLKGSMGQLKGLFMAVQQALEPLTKSIVGGFTKAIDGAVEALGWLGKKVESFLRAVGLDGLANKLANFAKTARESAESAEELAVAEDLLARKQRDARKIMLEYQRQAEELRQTRDDATKSAEEQEEANKKLLALLEKQKQVEGGIQKEAIRIAKERIALYGETTENLDALSQAETEYADVIKRITGQSSEAIKWQNDRLAKYKEEIYLLDEVTKKVLDVNYSQPNKAKRPTFDTEEDDEEIEDVTAIYTERNNLRLQYEKLGFDERLKLQKQNLDLERAQRIASGEDAINTEMWYQGEMTRVAKENADARREYITQLATQSMSATSDMIGALEELARESGASEEYMKKLAVAKIAINTATAIAQGVSGAMAVPFPANIPAILATITAVISGIAQAKSALSQASVPKYAQGGLVTGEGTATSDSIPAMLSDQEGVVKASAMAKYGAFVSAINEAEGGAPMATSTSIKSANDIMRQFADIVTSTPIYTAVTDINEGQARVAKIVDNSNY